MSVSASLSPVGPTPEFFPSRETLPEVLRELSPAKVWSAFSTLLSIPRESKHETQVADALVRYAERRRFECRVDKTGNVVIVVPGKGRGIGSAPLAVQAHMDMVCVAAPDVPHDFLKDPIRPERRKMRVPAHDTDAAEVEAIGAVGTTLGADNGIGLAMALALLEDETIEDRPPLEIVCTVDEETGLNGARKIGAGLITAPNLINLDTEEEGQVYRSCAGSSEFSAELPLTRQSAAPAGFLPLRLKLDGLPGGHSGVTIHEGKVNPLSVLSFVLAGMLTRMM